MKKISSFTYFTTGHEQFRKWFEAKQKLIINVIRFNLNMSNDMPSWMKVKDNKILGE